MPKLRKRASPIQSPLAPDLKALVPRLRELEEQLGAEKAQMVGKVLRAAMADEFDGLGAAFHQLAGLGADVGGAAQRLNTARAEGLELCAYISAAIASDQFERTRLGIKGHLDVRRTEARRTEGARALAHERNEAARREKEDRTSEMRGSAATVWQHKPDLSVEAVVKIIIEKERSKSGALPRGWSRRKVWDAIASIRPK